MNFISAINAIYYRLDKDTKVILEELNDKIYNKIESNTFRIKIENPKQRGLAYNYLKLLGYNIDYFKSGMFEIKLEKEF